LLADSQVLDRAGIRAILTAQPDCDVVAETASLEETLARAQECEADVLLLSLNLRGQDRTAAIPALRAAIPSLRIIALSERGEHNCVVLNPPARHHLPTSARCEWGTDCLQLAAVQGAMATLRRDAEPAELFRAVRAVASGQTALGAPPSTIAAHGSSLTRRELEVGALIAEGCSNKEISAALQVSDGTTKKHVRQLIAKLALADRLQVGLFLARHPQVFGDRGGSPRSERTPRRS
jgi:DNA-binding NarL/FixJ family response regulator